MSKLDPSPENGRAEGLGIPWACAACSKLVTHGCPWCKDTWYGLRPWVLAAEVSALIPFAHSALWIKLPETRAVLAPDEGAWASLMCGFFRHQWPHGTLEDPLQLAMWVYWMLGLFLQKYHLPRWGDTRTNVAHFGLIVATALLFSTAPHMVTLWALGIQGGYLPLDLFGDYAGTQGPWRHVQLGLILNQTLFLPLPAFLLSLASGLVKTSNRAWMTALLALLMFSLLLATHYWLND